MSAPPYPQRSPTHRWGSAVRPFRRSWSSTDLVAARCLLFHSDDLRGGPHGRARGRAIGPSSALGHISGRTAARRRGAHGSRAHALVAARSPCFALTPSGGWGRGGWRVGRFTRPRMGYASSGEDGPWTGAPGEASRLKQGQCARTPELVGIHPVSCPKAMHAGFCQRGDVDF
jgi:hypothetical protein